MRQDRTNRESTGKREGSVAVGLQWEGPDQRQVGSREEPTLDQQASEVSQTPTGLSADSHRLEKFV